MLLCSGVLFCNIYSCKEADAPAGIIISHLELISGSGRFSGGGSCELSHDFKRNPLCTFISANKGHFAVLWRKKSMSQQQVLWLKLRWQLSIIGLYQLPNFIENFFHMFEKSIIFNFFQHVQRTL